MLAMPKLHALLDTDNSYSNILGLLGNADLYDPSGFVP